MSQMEQTPRPGQSDREIDAAWERSIERALTGGLYKRVGATALDGTALVPSLSTEDQDYAVRVADGGAVHCSCLAGRTGQPCAHRAALALALFERELAQPLLPPEATPDTTPEYWKRRAHGLLPTLLSRYLEPRWRGRRGPLAPGMTRHDGLPEERLEHGPWRSPEQEAQDFRATTGHWPSWW